MATSADVQALAKRLEMITQEVKRSPERCVYGVNIAANYQADQDATLCVRKVVMNVNVFWCDDGCMDGPTDTPARDDDLLLLLPFRDTIEELDLQRTEISDAGLKTVAELTNLTSLNLAGAAIRGSGLAHLATLTKLEHLDLSKTKVEPEELQALGALQSLRTVLVPEQAITDDVLAVLGRLPKLQSLALGKSQVTDRGLESIARLESLELLDLSETKITDRGLVHLAGLTNLKRLQLARTQITGAGLSQLARLTNLQHLDLEDTLTDDAGLAHLSGIRQLEFLKLAGTRVQGFGLAELTNCGNLHEVILPPIPTRAVEAVNTVKSWRSLCLTLAAPDETPTIGPASVATINDMPELTCLEIKSQGPLDALHVVNCLRFSQLVVTNGAAEGAGTALHLDNLPDLQALQLRGAFRQIEARSALKRVEHLTIRATVTPQVVRAINRCGSLRWLDMDIAEATGDPAPISELSELPQVRYAQVQLRTPDASWVLRLVGRMSTLKKLDLRGQDLTAEDLTPLSNCTQLTEIYIRGINDPGEPLAFLDSMPDLDQCLVLGSPRVGKVRLTEKSGVRRFYFKYGQLDELEIDAAPNLTAVYLGNRAFGYNDHDATLPRLDIRRLTAHNADELLYLMVDAQRTNIPFTEIVLGDCPKLRSLTLHAPRPGKQPARCRLDATGTYSRLAERKLFHLATDAESLARLSDSAILRRQVTEDVELEDADKETRSEETPRGAAAETQNLPVILD